MEGPEPISSVDLKGLPPRLRPLKTLIEKAARLVMKTHGVKSYALSVTFMNDRRIAGLNRVALKREGPTDVIAFDLSERGLPYKKVGDIYVSLDRARASSRTFGVTEKEEVLRLVVHGMLHVLGYKDLGRLARRKMELVQERAVKRIFH